MVKCWQLLTWDIPLQMLRHYADGKAKAVVLEAKKDYVKPKGKASCPKCGQPVEPISATIRSNFLQLIELYPNWHRDGTFKLGLKCVSCTWFGQGDCVLVEVRS